MSPQQQNVAPNLRGRYGSVMSAYRAHVRQGHLVLNEPTDLPEGAEVLLFPNPEEDDLAEEDRQLLQEALDESLREMEVGEFFTSEEVFRSLRALRG